MPANRKVVWAEGILLGQQHFQAWDKFISHQQALIQRHTLAYGWGIAELEIDESFLPQGIFHLTRCSALLEDGRWIDFNHVFDEPLTKPLPEQSTATLNVYLTLPENNAVFGINGYDEGSREAAWTGKYHSVCDEYDCERTSEVLLAKQNLNLHLNSDALEGLSALKIAELIFNPQQMSYQLNRNYFPPVLKIGASAALVSWVAGIKSKIIQQIAILNEQKAKHRHIHNQFGYTEFIYFNLIKSLTSHLPKLCELQKAAQLHPYHLYSACTALIGELWGYLDSPLSATDLPVYQHKALSQLFHDLQLRIDNLLSNVMPVNTLDVALERVSDSRYQSVSISAHDLKTKTFCLALYHEEMTPELIKKIMAQVKIASPDRLNHIVQSFTPGVEFEYLKSPGNNLMAKHHYHYFLLNKQSNGWEEIVSEGQMAIFVSQDLASYPFELISYA